MSAVQIVDVTLRDDARVGGAAVDAPRRGSTALVHVLSISGWVLGSGQPAVAVDVTHHGEVLRTAPVNLARQDVIARLLGQRPAARPGFAMQIGLVGLPTEFQLDLRVTLDGGGAVKFASIRGRREPLDSGYRPALRPLLVTSLARTGTSRLMRLLAHHPAVVADRQHPHETRVARYWAHAFTVLTEPAEHAASADPDGFAASRHSVGHNPYFFGHLAQPSSMADWFGRIHPARVAEFVQATIDSFYTELARRQGTVSPFWFAEKHLPDRFPALLRELYPEGREIFLVRDPRDMAASMLAFNSKRGHAAFGSERAANDEQFVAQLRPRLLRLKRAWEERGSSAVLVRYEDLVRSPAETLAATLDRLALGGPEASAQALLAAASRGEDTRDHRTSDSPTASVGRWRRDLSPAVQAACVEAFDDLVEVFGYERAEPGAGVGRQQRR